MNFLNTDRASDLNVSRETFDRLKAFEALVHKWNPRINLVSKASLRQVWTRHIVDSIQVYRLGARAGHWVDLGSGGGFPGLVVAILAAEDVSGTAVTLIESDKRKCAFLREVARETGVNCRVQADRIERVDPLRADVLSARALSDLSGLLTFCERHLSPQGTGLFPKGAKWKTEIDAAKRNWTFSYDAIKSSTEPEAVILKVEGISRV